MKKILCLALLTVSLCANAQFKKQFEQNNWRGGYAELKDASNRKDFHPVGYRGMLYITPTCNAARTLGFMTVHGVQTSSRMFIGLGFGGMFGDCPDDEYSDKLNGEYFTLFADARYAFNNRRLSPYFDVQLGGRLNSADDAHSTDYKQNHEVSAKNGIYFSPSFGLTFAITRKLALDITMAYILGGTGYNESYDSMASSSSSTIPVSYGFVGGTTSNTTVQANGMTHYDVSEFQLTHQLQFRIGVQF